MNPSLELGAKWATPVNNLSVLSLLQSKITRANINGTEQKPSQKLLYELRVYVVVEIYQFDTFKSFVNALQTCQRPQKLCLDVVETNVC